MIEKVIDKVLEQFCKDNIENEKIKVEFEIKNIEKLNGYIDVPNNISLPIKIVIGQNVINQYVEKDYQVFCTIYHELVHAWDYYNYCKKYYDGDYILMKNNKNFQAFYLWSEFNAKRRSYIYYRDLLQQKVSRSIQFDALMNKEIPYINENINYEIENYNGGDLLYYIVHYLARYMVWEEIFLNQINNYSYINENVKTMLGNSLKPLYEFLKKNKNMPSNSEDWDNFNKIITESNLNITIYLAQKIN